VSETAVITVDATGAITQWSAAAEALFGHRAADVIGRDVVMLVPDAYRAAHEHGFARAMDGAPTRAAGIGAHLPVRRADGSIIVVAGRFDVLRAPDGSPAGAVATYRGADGDPAPFTPVSGQWPTVRRIVANLPAADPAADASFWTGILGLETAMDHGWVVNHRRGDVQVQVMSTDASAPVNPAVSVEVRDTRTLEAVHDAVVAAGLEIVHPLTDEPWGVRRFFVRTPQGSVVNIVAHAM
jgi:PAS domain S-box-containing protein